MYRKKHHLIKIFLLKMACNVFSFLLGAFILSAPFVLYTLTGSVLNAVIHFTFSLPLATILLVYAYSGFEEIIYSWHTNMTQAKANLRKLRRARYVPPRTVKKSIANTERVVSKAITGCGVFRDIPQVKINLIETRKILQIELALSIANLSEANPIEIRKKIKSIDRQLSSTSKIRTTL
ncbi:hypothetical protein HJW41_RS24275 [Escherichia coli]